MRAIPVNRARLGTVIKRKHVMCTRSLVVVSLVLSSLPVMAEGGGEQSFHVEAQIFSSGLTRTVGIVNGSLSKNFGYYVFTHAASDGYKEVFAGPTWRPVECIEVGIGIGRENLPRPSSTRRNAYLFAECGSITATAALESGGSGRWHRVDLLYNVTGKFGAGLGVDATFGYGPRVEYKIEKDVTLSSGLLHDRVTNKTTGVLGASFKF